MSLPSRPTLPCPAMACLPVPRRPPRSSRPVTHQGNVISLSPCSLMLESAFSLLHRVFMIFNSWRASRGTSVNGYCGVLGKLLAGVYFFPLVVGCACSQLQKLPLHCFVLFYCRISVEIWGGRWKKILHPPFFPPCVEIWEDVKKEKYLFILKRNCIILLLLLLNFGWD